MTRRNPERLDGRAPRRASVWPLLAALGAAALTGCSRTHDGTVVPAYQFALARPYGIPMVTLEPTPLDPPARRAAFPPPPEAQAPRPVVSEPRRPVRRSRPAAAQPRPSEPTIHKCERVSPPSGGRVVVSCG